jgi:glycosyltransferase involved in cell wall biosynthesis
VNKVESLSVVIPMLNEENNVRDVLSEAIRVASSLPLRFEIIAVNDRSSDATADILERLALTDDRIKVVHNRKRLGLGGALRAGFLRASGQVIFYTDADIPCEINGLLTAVDLMGQLDADIVSAYKSNPREYGFKRTIYSFVYNKLINILFRVNLRDVNFSFKLFRRDKLNELMLKSSGSFINAELFIKARRAGYVIVEFPARYLPRSKGNSKLDNFGNIAKIICELLIFMTRHNLRRRWI